MTLFSKKTISHLHKMFNIILCVLLLIPEIPAAPPTTTASSTEEPAGKSSFGILLFFYKCIINSTCNIMHPLYLDISPRYRASTQCDRLLNTVTLPHECLNASPKMIRTVCLGSSYLVASYCSSSKESASKMKRY